MKKIILVDGNNLMFRSYYATAYSGTVMRNSKGLATNALYGFVAMINKIIEEEKPKYMAVAFDIGKNFRHEKYKAYKAGRRETPDDLKVQMPIAKKLLDAMGIKHYEKENYEADDIIGTLAKKANDDPEYYATIVSSDRDLLQLIDKQVEVKLLKQKGHIRYTEETFKDDYGIDPIRIIDLKGLSGDPSDNIPGVKGIGEKTALKLLQQYGTVENIYDNIVDITGKLQDKLLDGKDSAFFSKDVATIYTEVEISDSFADMEYTGPNEDELTKIYEDLEFYSFIKSFKKKVITANSEYKILNRVDEINKNNIVSYYIECDSENYHNANILGMGLFDGVNCFYVDASLIKDVMEYLKDTIKYTFDLKKNIVLLKDECQNTIYDAMIAAYLLNYNFKDDLAYLLNNDGISVAFFDEIIKRKQDIKAEVTIKAKYIYDTRDDYIKKIKFEDMYSLFYDIEMPLVHILADMELTGVKINPDILDKMKIETEISIKKLETEIYSLAGEEFKISSPKQLGNILFEKLGLPHGKKNSSGYSTEASILEKIIGIHPIVEKILQYRNLTKIYTSYILGLKNYLTAENKIHTIYKQTLTRTGRLSSVEPNLQNIPTRDEDGKKIKEAFIPSHDLFLSCDYSQIELRVLAHISGSKDLIEAFVNEQDIHTVVASDIFGVSESEVTKNMRRTAKAVIFGIVYGISGFGLGENIGISPKEAKKFIEKYYELYPGVKEYMDNIIKEAHETGSVRTLFNRKRIINELSSKMYNIRASGERIALNTPIQGTAADIIKKAMVEIYQKFKENNIKSKMILQVHDELIFDVYKEEKDIVKKIVTETMENVIKLKVPLHVSADFGTTWLDTK